MQMVQRCKWWNIKRDMLLNIKATHLTLHMMVILIIMEKWFEDQFKEKCKELRSFACSGTTSKTMSTSAFGIWESSRSFQKVCWKKFSHQSPSLAALTKALIWSTWVILNCLIFSFTLFLKINLGGLLEVLIKPHGEQVVTQPGWPGIFLFFFFRPGMEWNLNQHLHWMARYRRRTNPMMRRRRNHHQRTKNTW